MLERYYEGTDERWGTPLGKVKFDAATLHDLRSVTKSVVGLLYGIALAEGRVPALDTPVLDAFPAYAELAKDERRRAILVSHVLSMTMGLAWNENLPYNDPRNSEIAMERSGDRFRYVLEQPIVSAPGEKWTVEVARLHHRNPVSAYAGRTLIGVVRETWLRGIAVDDTPRGRLLRRGER